MIEAQALKKAVIDKVTHYYEIYGVLFEFYDASDNLPPVRCDRKGPWTGTYDIRAKMDAIRDYHWTAALVLDLILQ